MKALIVESDRKIAGVLAIHLKNELGLDYECCFDVTEALNLLTVDSCFDLIIVRKIMGESKTQDGREAAREICARIYDYKLKTSVLCLGQFEYIGVPCVSLPEHFKLNDFTRTITKLLNLSRSKIIEMKLPDFIAIPINHFFVMNNCACDIFMKLKKGDFDEYVKRINARDDFDKAAISRYHEKFGLQEFYIRKEDRQEFFESLFLQTQKKLINERFSLDQKLEVIVDSFCIAQNFLVHVGIDENSVKMARAIIDSIKQLVLSNYGAGVILKKIIEKQSSYSCKHSLALSLLFQQTLMKMDWCPQGQYIQLLEKMIFISFFHDVYLEEDHLVLIENKDHFKCSTLTDAEKKLVMNHANQAANLAQLFPHTPLGVDIIIRQHHGISNGVGFPDSYGISISSISIYFIVVENFVHELLAISQTKKPVSQILDDLYVRFSMSSYRKILDVLRENVWPDL